MTASVYCNISVKTSHQCTVFMLAAIRTHMIATSCCIQQHSLGLQHLAAASWSGVYDTVPLPVLLQQVQVLLQTLNLMAQCSVAFLTCQPASPIAKVAAMLCEQCLLVCCMVYHNGSDCMLSDALGCQVCNASRCRPVNLLCYC